MSASQNEVPKRYGLFVLAILLLLSGGVCLYLGSHNLLIRVLGLVAIIASTHLVRISHVHDRAGLPDASGRGNLLQRAKGAGRLPWVLSFASLVSLVAAYYLMYIDAANGGHEAWPADVFAGVGFACVVVWTYLAAKIAAGG